MQDHGCKFGGCPEYSLYKRADIAKSQIPFLLYFFSWGGGVRGCWWLKQRRWPYMFELSHRAAPPAVKYEALGVWVWTAEVQGYFRVRGNGEKFSSGAKMCSNGVGFSNRVHCQGHMSAMLQISRLLGGFAALITVTVYCATSFPCFLTVFSGGNHPYREERSVF